MKPTRTSPPTISEVAKTAGVGRATAARTLGGYGYVSAEMRERVLAAAEQLGYRANALARSVSTGVSHAIGVVVADISNPFFGGLVRGIVDTSRPHGVDAFVLSTYENIDDEIAAVQALVDKRVDGIILASAAVDNGQTAHLDLAHRQDIPVVLIDRKIRGVSLDAVVIDNRTAVRYGVDAFIEQGHRRIGFVWGPPLEERPTRRRDLVAGTEADLSTDGERLLGYLDALDDRGIALDPDLVMIGPKNEERVMLDVQRMVGLEDPPTAIFCTETDATTGALRALRERGLRVPNDISLIGMDDSSWAEVMEPPLSMVEQPVQAIGVRAAEILFARIGGDTSPVIDVRLDTRLTLRGSLAPPGG